MAAHKACNCWYSRGLDASLSDVKAYALLGLPGCLPFYSIKMTKDM